LDPLKSNDVTLPTKGFDMHDTGMKRPHELMEAVGNVFRALPLAGASVVGITAFGAMTGGLYVQSYFETIHAAWAIELVPTSTVIRSGLIGASSLAIAVASTLAMAVVGIARWRTMGWVLGALVLAALVFYGLSQGVPQATVGRFAWWLDLGVVVFASYAIAILVVMTLGRRTRSRRARQTVAALATALVVVVGTLLPIQRGSAEGHLALGTLPSSLHPDVCIAGDPRLWRLVRALDGEMLVGLISDGEFRHLRRVDKGQATDIRYGRQAGTAGAQCEAAPRAPASGSAAQAASLLAIPAMVVAGPTTSLLARHSGRPGVQRG
jgi:hypothetical protein